MQPAPLQLLPVDQLPEVVVVLQVQTADAVARAGAGHRKAAARAATRPPPREIAWLLIRYRMDNGLTQEELAERVGTSHSQISRIESGRHRPNLDTLERIAHALDLKLLVEFESTKNGRSKRDLVKAVSG